MAKALMPAITALATLYVATGAFRGQRRFDRKTEVERELRQVYAEYLNDLITVGRSRGQKDIDALRDEVFSDLSMKIGKEYQYILLFSPDVAVRKAAEDLSLADAKRHGAMMIAKDPNIQSLNKTFMSLSEGETQFHASITAYIAKVREATQSHLNGGGLIDRLRSKIAAPKRPR